MFKPGKWRAEKNKIKPLFRFHFKATQVPQLGWDAMMVSLIPLDVGRPTSRSHKAEVIHGACSWTKPILERVKLSHDPKSGTINPSLYQFIVSTTGSTKTGLLGEASINLADYVEAFNPSWVSLPLTPANTGAILHVMIERIQGDGADARECDGNGAVIQLRRKTLKSQFSLSDMESRKVTDGTKNTDSTEQGDASVNIHTQEKYPSSRALSLQAESNSDLRKSSSSDTIWASGSDSSSGRYTPKANGFLIQNIHQESSNILSPHCNDRTSCAPRTNSADSDADFKELGESNAGWCINSAAEGCVRGSTNSIGDSSWREIFQDPDATIENLRGHALTLSRQLEISDLELQTIRKQVVKESRRGQDLQRDLNSLKYERDALLKEGEELKALQRRSNKGSESINSKFESDNPWPMLDEIRQELNHEKNLNSNLRLQLQKTQEANSELILAVRDLDEILEQKKCDSSGCRLAARQLEISTVDPDIVDLSFSERKQGSVETTTENDDEEQHYDDGQYELEELIKEHDELKIDNSGEQPMVDLKSENVAYSKDREDIEMQMEQLALDYEILKQENHDISSRLEQVQLREQLRMQYECSAHLVIINDLETHIEMLEKELTKQAEAYEAEIQNLMHVKVQQEQRAIQAEEALRMTKRKNASTAEQIQEEFKRLSVQMSSAFCANETLAMQAIAEARELRLEKSQLEELLVRSNEDLAYAQIQYKNNLGDLLNLTNIKGKEIDKLTYEYKSKCQELESLKKSEMANRKVYIEELLDSKAEIEKGPTERNSLSEQMQKKEKTLINIEKSALKGQPDLLKMDPSKLNKEVDHLQYVNVVIEETESVPSSEMEILKTNYNKMENSFSDGNYLEDEQGRENAMADIVLQHEICSTMPLVLIEDKKLNARIIHTHCPSTYSATEDTSLPDENELVEETNNLEKPSDMAAASECDEASASHPEKVNQRSTSGHAEMNQEFSQSCTSNQIELSETLREMVNLRGRNLSMEAELKEMQERYSELSLRFAEVEGERQQLVMRVRSLKNGMK